MKGTPSTGMLSWVDQRYSIERTSKRSRAHCSSRATRSAVSPPWPVLCDSPPATPPSPFALARAGVPALARLVRLAAGDHHLALRRRVRAHGMRGRLGREVHPLRRLRARPQVQTEAVRALGVHSGEVAAAVEEGEVRGHHELV